MGGVSVWDLGQPALLGTRCWEVRGLQGDLAQAGGEQVGSARALVCGKQHICPWVSTSSPLSTCCFHLGVGVRLEATTAAGRGQAEKEARLRAPHLVRN